MTSGAWPGHQECVKSPDVPDVDLGCSTGLVWGVIGATGSEPFPQARRRRICFGTSDCWEGQVQEAAPEIWPLLTPPGLPPPRGAHQPQPLWGRFRSSCHVELAPSPGPCFPLCWSPHSLALVWLLHLAIQASKSTPCFRQNPRNVGSTGTRFSPAVFTLSPEVFS